MTKPYDQDSMSATERAIEETNRNMGSKNWSARQASRTAPHSTLSMAGGEMYQSAGMKRPSQEDRAGVVALQGNLSNQTGETLAKILYDAYANLAQSVEVKFGPAAKAAAERYLNPQANSNMGSQGSVVGSTLTASLCVGNRLVTANVGDSATFLATLQPDGTYTLMLRTENHNVSTCTAEEKERVQAARRRICISDGNTVTTEIEHSRIEQESNGGFYINHGFQNARAIGDLITKELDVDHDNTPTISAEPSIVSDVIPSRGKTFVIHVSDGVTDVLNFERLAKALHDANELNNRTDPLSLPAKMARELLRDAIAWGSNDNVTAVVREMTPTNSQPILSFLADGHGGDEVAQFIQEYLPGAVQDQINRLLHTNYLAPAPIPACPSINIERPQAPPECDPCSNEAFADTESNINNDLPKDRTSSKIRFQAARSTYRNTPQAAETPVATGLQYKGERKNGEQEDRFNIVHLGENKTDVLSREAMAKALHLAIQRLQTSIETDLTEVSRLSGAVLTASLQHHGRIVTANVGDSATFLAFRGKNGKYTVKKRTVRDSAADCPASEQARVLSIKAELLNNRLYIADGSGTSFEFTRSLGDWAAQGMSHEPRLAVDDVNSDLETNQVYLIQLCDGISDTLTTKHIEYFLNHNKVLNEYSPDYADEKPVEPIDIAGNLIQYAYEWGSRDDLTALCLSVPTINAPAWDQFILSFVADGHGGAEVAEYIKNNFARILYEELEKQSQLKAEATAPQSEFPDVLAQLTQYQSTRTKEAEYSGNFRCGAKFFGYSRTNKLAAVGAFEKVLTGKENADTLKAHENMLNQGRLGKIYREYLNKVTAKSNPAASPPTPRSTGSSS